MATCEPLQGNADFYGLGIRIGIYLQWGSAWLSMLLDPESAQGVLDANSVSLFAVAIATIIAAARNAAAIEMYIMLQILLGFPVTTLSSFGVRLWLMSPRRLDKLRSRVTMLWRQDREKRREAAEIWDQTQQELQERPDEEDVSDAQNPDLDGPDENSMTPRLTREALEALRQALRERKARRRSDYTQYTMQMEAFLDWGDVVALPFWFPSFLSNPRPQLYVAWVSLFYARTLAIIPSVGFPIDIYGTLYALWHFPVTLPLRFLSSLKFPGLSWSGVLWRTTAVAILMAYNLAYWFDSNGHGVQEPPDPGCGPPTVFMFSIQTLQEPITTLGRVAAVMIAVAVGPPTFVLVMLTIRIIFYGVLYLYRDVYFLIAAVNPQSFQSILDRINDVQDQHPLALVMFEALPPIMQSSSRTLVDLLGFMSSYNTDNIRFSDVIKVGVSLGLGRPVKRQSENQNRGGQALLSRAQTIPVGWRANGRRGGWLGWFCVWWNILTVLSIAWFIMSVELTIRWNNIQGVNTIDSTGQLIPFIMGCVSASQVLKKVILLALGKKFPDWADTEVEILENTDGLIRWKIKKRSADDLGAAHDPRSGAGGNGSAHGAIPLSNLRQGSTHSQPGP